jgi:hypothetical protein
MVVALSVVSGSLGCLSELEVDGSIYHPCISFQMHGKICDSSPGILCYNNDILTY